MSQHLTRHASCPVGIDGSPTSAAALDYACRRAEATGETVVAIHGWHVRDPSTDVWSSRPRTVESSDRDRLLAESVAGVRADHPDVRFEQEPIPVAPEQCLVDASASASLVVVGSRGLGFFSGLLLGSVSL